MRDLKFALRQIRRSPGFAVTALLTLALGIGANVAVFQLLYSVVLAPLPVPQPQQLVSLHAVQSPFDGQWFVSYPAYQRLRQATGTSTPVIARTGFGMGLLQVENQTPRDARFQLVSDNFFSVLGVRASAGRLLEASDARQNSNEWPAVLRYGFAVRQFGSTSIVGRHAVLNGLPVVIVGVADKRFLGLVTGYAPDLWLPLEAEATGKAGAWFDSLGPGYGIHLGSSWLDQPGVFWLWLTARVPSGQRAEAEARWTAALQPDLALRAEAARAPQEKAAILHARVRLVPAGHGEGSLTEDSYLPLVVLMALSGVVFLAGCVNLANLQAARMSAWQRDFSVRMSLGASRGRLLRQVLTEGALLTLAGGLLAMMTGRAASLLLVRWASSRNWPLDLDMHAGGRVMLLGAGLMLLALCFFSLFPALRALRGEIAGAIGLNRIHAATPESAAARRWSSTMMAVQVSLSLVLVAMAACFAGTLVSLNRMDTGMDRGHVLSVHVDMVHGYAAKQASLPSLYRLLVERLDGLPGVRSAAVEMCEIPNCGWNTALYAFGKGDLSGAHGEEDPVGPGYFRAMGIALLRGRGFSDDDRADTQKVAVLNQAYARKLFGDESPVGRWIGYRKSPDDREFLVVGEVADARVDGPERPAPPVLYPSIDQNPAPIHSIEVRTTGSVDSMAPEIREALHVFDPELPVTEIVPLKTELDDGISRQELLARLTGTLAGITLLLAVIGFYGVMSYRVARRRGEIGIRMALGATRGDVQRMILRQTLMVYLAGLLPGVALTEIAVHASRSLMFGAGRASWLVLAGSSAALAAAGFLATLLPARRAALVEPMEALRNE